MRDGIVFIDKKQSNLTTMCIQKQYYFVTEYFILKFTSATVSRIQGNRMEFKTSRFVKPRNMNQYSKEILKFHILGK